MARSVDNIDVDIPVSKGSILCLDSNAFFPFQVHIIHHALFDDLVGPEQPRLSEQAIDQGGLSMVHVSDDCNVTNVLLHIGRQRFSPFPRKLRSLQAFGQRSSRHVCLFMGLPEKVLGPRVGHMRKGDR